MVCIWTGELPRPLAIASILPKEYLGWDLAKSNAATLPPPGKKQANYRIEFEYVYQINYILVSN
jgi:hypothetical protein